MVLSNLARDLEERVPELAKVETAQTGRAVREMKAQVRSRLFRCTGGGRTLTFARDTSWGGFRNGCESSVWPTGLPRG